MAFGLKLMGWNLQWLVMACACLDQVPADLSTFNENPAWPVVLDDFVECAEHKRKDMFEA